MFASPNEMELIPESELDARYDEQEANQSSLLHLFLRGGKAAFVNLDQNGDGYCWGYSTGQAIMVQRLAMGLPLIRLNPHATCAIIKKGKDEGGWGGLSAKFGTDFGYAEEGNGPGQWPLHLRSLKYDTPELRAIWRSTRLPISGWTSQSPSTIKTSHASKCGHLVSTINRGRVITTSSAIPCVAGLAMSELRKDIGAKSS